MSAPPTGRIVRTESGIELVIERTFRAPIEDVWRSITEPERMNRWIGTWEGEAGPGKRVMFTMTAEGDAVPEETLIHRCDPPTHLAVESSVGGMSWPMQVDLSEANGVTTLVFQQSIDPGDEHASSYGPGWEYYLDRLATIHAGADFADWDDYYPAQVPYWEAQLRQANGSTA